MNKNIYLFIISFVLLILLSACNINTLTSTTSTISETTTTTNEMTTTTENQTPQPIEYELVWNDEFDYVGKPDDTKWLYETGGGGWGNNELQYYTNREDNAYVNEGVLTITLKKEAYLNRNYTSARLNSINEGSFKYGRIEVKAKLPEGLGTWPAIWMLPTDWVYGGWPKSGEIDIMEHVGYDMNNIHGTIHVGNHYGGNPIGNEILINDVVNNYHVYAIEWEENQINWYVDDEKYFTVLNNNLSNPDNSYMNWPFDQRFHILLNIAFGGNWGGAQGIDPNFISSQMVIDYVRVYQKDYSQDQESPTDITNLTLVSNDPTHTKLTWSEANDNNGIAHYEIYVNEVLYGKTTTTSYTLTNLDALTHYEINVVAVDYGGNFSMGVVTPITTGNYISLPAKIEAENYFDMEGIELETCTDIGLGQNVGYINPNDYLTYKVNVSDAGTYKIIYRVASLSNGGNISLYGGDGTHFLTQTTFIKTNGWQTWVSVESEPFSLQIGENLIKIVANSEGFNINYFEFVKVGE